MLSSRNHPLQHHLLDNLTYKLSSYRYWVCLSVLWLSRCFRPQRKLTMWSERLSLTCAGPARATSLQPALLKNRFGSFDKQPACEWCYQEERESPALWPAHQFPTCSVRGKSQASWVQVSTPRHSQGPRPCCLAPPCPHFASCEVKREDAWHPASTQ